MIRPIRSILRRSGEWGIGLKYKQFSMDIQEDYNNIERYYYGPILV